MRKYLVGDIILAKGCSALASCRSFFSGMILLLIAVVLLVPVVLLYALRRYCRAVRILRANNRVNGSREAVRVAFLHPECLNGGGGERVLWIAVQALHVKFPSCEIVVCAPWEIATSDSEAVSKAKARIFGQFHIDIPDFTPVRASLTHLTNPAKYPRFTLLFQACGAALSGLEAYMKCKADVFVDTANQPFALVFAKLLGATTVSYIHYPTISSDMLTVVRERKPQFNNSGFISYSYALSHAKLLYYYAFARLYACAGRFSDLTMANSAWTGSHIRQIWKRPVCSTSKISSGHNFNDMERNVLVVYPPCDTTLLATLPLSSNRRVPGLVLSVAQYRPEKNHLMQLEIMRELRAVNMLSDAVKVKLVMVGGARNDADRARVIALRKVRSNMGLDRIVDIRVNVSWDELLELYSRASIGLHTMRDEHFGISIVAQQAAGLIPVCHRSGGVASDIIEDGLTGFLADDIHEYVEKLARLLRGGSDGAIDQMRPAARASAGRFSDSIFGEKISEVLNRALALANTSLGCQSS